MKTHLRYAYLVLTLALPYVVFGNPQGPNIVSGDVHIDHPDSKTMHIRAGEKAIVEWSDFSIDAGEKTKFIQPNSKSAILNRVKGKYPSSIFGRLEANGKVYLINPNGVLIGKNGVVTAASFLASTHHLSNEDFLNGKEHHLKGDSREKVINYGSIEAVDGDVILVGHHVENSGSIEAIKGEVLIGAGNEVIIRPAGDDRVQIRLSEPVETKEGTGIEQLGTIQAIRAQLQADGNLYALAINQEGIVQAEGSIEKDGQVYLVAESGRSQLRGTLAAKNANGTGGEVRVLGDSVVLVDQAKIDVSGDAGGGTVLIGGDYQGKNPAILNSNLTWIGPEANIEASALDSGNGGRVIVWSDEMTSFQGNIRIEGGQNSGDGGFAEVSGKQHLEFGGLVTALAPCGKTGQLLLDPTNITIQNGAAITGSFSACPNSNYIVQPATNPNLIGTTVIANQVGMCDVTISTNGNIDFAVGTTLSLNSTNSLSFVTQSGSLGDISLPEEVTITNTAAGTINFTADGTFSTNGTPFEDVISTSGALNFTTGVDCDFTDAAPGVHIFAKTGITVQAGRDINVDGANVEIANQGNGNMNILFIANDSINITQGTISTTFGSGGGSITLVVDNSNPASPAIGTGSFNIGSSSSLSTRGAGNGLFIYTAKESQNTIAAGTQFNGSAFVTETVGVDSPTAKWSVYYPQPTAGLGNPYTFFYKEPVVTPPPPPPPPTPSPSPAPSPTTQQVVTAVATVQTVGFVSTASPSTSSAAVVQSYNPFTNFHIQLPDSLVFSLYAPSPIQADRPRPDPLSFTTSVEYIEQPSGTFDVQQSTPISPTPESTLTPSTFGSEATPSPSGTETAPSPVPSETETTPPPSETETNSSGSETEESPSSVETAASPNFLFF